LPLLHKLQTVRSNARAWHAPSVAYPRDRTRGVEVEHHVMLSTFLEPVNNPFDGYQLCVEGHWLVADITGALNDGSPVRFVVWRDRSESCRSADRPVSPWVALYRIAPGLSTGSLEPHAVGAGLHLTSFLDQLVVVASLFEPSRDSVSAGIVCSLRREQELFRRSKKSSQCHE
jgi:hypothetical protein